MPLSPQLTRQSANDVPRGLTVCAVDDVTPDLAMDALARSLRAMPFERAVILSSRRPKEVADGVEYVEIPPIKSRDEYSYFMLNGLHSHIFTSHVLVVQWDGFVLDGSAWDDAFLDYDYIGAIWGWHAERKVGNGGFSLRSHKLLQAVAQIAPEQMAGLGEDEVICRALADRLENEYGIRFAPEAVARRFAYERTLPEGRTLGFHGLFNLWRHLGDEELARVLAVLPEGTIKNREFLEFLACCLSVKRFSVVRAGVNLLSKFVGNSMVEVHLRRCGVDTLFIKALLNV
ncbi:MAG: hypothetical protein LKE96_05960 [Acetobacter peroxydans]|jgi:hypothetical protein|nr:hypothetical protein [Acetobacter peroxydans]